MELEIKKLWNNIEMDFVVTVLILIYTGFRIGEFLNVKIKDINLENQYIIGGSKTEAGKDRLILLHNKIIPLIKNRIKNNETNYSNYLFAKTPSITTEDDNYNNELLNIFGQEFFKTLFLLGKNAYKYGIAWLHVYYDNESNLLFKIFDSK